ncbi:hypothetical protein Tco_0755458 [Tanacetum coccineum]
MMLSNACEMWKAIERLKQGESINVQDLETNLYWEFGKFTSRDGESLKSYYLRNRGKAIVTSSAPTYDPEPATVTEDEEMSKEKEIDKLMALISLSFKKIYKPTNNNHRTSSNTSRANQDNSPRINRGTGYDNQRAVNVVGARENVGIGSSIIGTMAQLQEQPESSNDIYLAEQGDTNITIDSSDICYDRAQDDQDETDDLDQERDLLASLIQKLKCEIDDSKNRNKIL